MDNSLLQLIDKYYNSGSSLDITATGVGGLKGLLGLSLLKPMLTALDVINNLGNVNYGLHDTISLQYSPLSPDASVGLELLNRGYGNSKYDLDINHMYQTEDINEFRALDLPWYDLIANGLVKGVVTAGTTLVDGVLGLLYGAGVGTASLYEEATGKDLGWDDTKVKVLTGDLTNEILKGFWRSLWDNGISNSMADISEQMEESFKNYRSNWELNAPFYERMFSSSGAANFWGDDILKNAGFTIGAAGAIALTSGAGSLTFGKLLANMGKFGKYVGMVAKTFVGSAGEASMEALNATRENRKSMETNLNIRSLEISKQIEALYNQDLANGMSVELAMQKKLDAYAKLALDLLAYKVNMEQNFTDTSNAIFAANMAVLSISNNLTLGSMIRGGYNTSKSMMEQLIKTSGGKAILSTEDLTKALLDGTLQYSSKPVALLNLKVFGHWLLESTLEGLEEGVQNLASNTGEEVALARTNKLMSNSMLGAMINPSAGEELLSYSNALSRAYLELFGKANSSGWTEVAAGFISGALGIPGIHRNSLGKLRPTMNGGIFESYETINGGKKQLDEFAGIMNQALGNRKFGETARTAARNIAIHDSMNKALLAGSTYAFKNYEVLLVVNNAIYAKNNGMLDAYMGMFDLISLGVSDEDLQQLKAAASKDGNDAFKGMTDDLIKETYAQKAQSTKDKIKKALDNYSKVLDTLKGKIKDEFKEFAETEFTYQLSLNQDLHRRRKEIDGELQTLLDKEDKTEIDRREILDKKNAIRELDKGIKASDELIEKYTKHPEELEKEIQRQIDAGAKIERLKDALKAIEDYNKATTLKDMFDIYTNSPKETREETLRLAMELATGEAKDKITALHSYISTVNNARRIVDGSLADATTKKEVKNYFDDITSNLIENNDFSKLSIDGFKEGIDNAVKEIDDIITDLELKHFIHKAEDSDDYMLNEDLYHEVLNADGTTSMLADPLVEFEGAYTAAGIQGLRKILLELKDLKEEIGNVHSILNVGKGGKKKIKRKPAVEEEETENLVLPEGVIHAPTEGGGKTKTLGGGKKKTTPTPQPLNSIELPDNLKDSMKVSPFTTDLGVALYEAVITGDITLELADAYEAYLGDVMNKILSAIEELDNTPNPSEAKILSTVDYVIELALSRALNSGFFRDSLEKDDEGHILTTYGILDFLDLYADYVKVPEVLNSPDDKGASLSEESAETPTENEGENTDAEELNEGEESLDETEEPEQPVLEPSEKVDYEDSLEGNYHTTFDKHELFEKTEEDGKLSRNLVTITHKAPALVRLDKGILYFLDAILPRVQNLYDLDIHYVINTAERNDNEKSPIYLAVKVSDIKARNIGNRAKLALQNIGGEEYVFVGTLGYYANNDASAKSFDIINGKTFKLHSEGWEISECTNKFKDVQEGSFVKRVNGVLQDHTLKELLSPTNNPYGYKILDVGWLIVMGTEDHPTSRYINVHNPYGINKAVHPGEVYMLMPTAKGNMVPVLVHPKMWSEIRNDARSKQLIDSVNVQLRILADPATTYNDKKKAMATLNDYFAWGKNYVLHLNSEDDPINGGWIRETVGGVPKNVFPYTDTSRTLEENLLKLTDALLDLNPRINITSRGLESLDLDSWLYNSSALETDMALMGVFGTRTFLYTVDKDGNPQIKERLKPNNTFKPNGTVYSSFYMDGDFYMYDGSNFYDKNGNFVETTDELGATLAIEQHLYDDSKVITINKGKKSEQKYYEINGDLITSNGHGGYYVVPLELADLVRRRAKSISILETKEGNIQGTAKTLRDLVKKKGTPLVDTPELTLVENQDNPLVDDSLLEDLKMYLKLFPIGTAIRDNNTGLVLTVKKVDVGNDGGISKVYVHCTEGSHTKSLTASSILDNLDYEGSLFTTMPSETKENQEILEEEKNGEEPLPSEAPVNEEPSTPLVPSTSNEMMGIEIFNDGSTSGITAFDKYQSTLSVDSDYNINIADLGMTANNTDAIMGLKQGGYITDRAMHAMMANKDRAVLTAGKVDKNGKVVVPIDTATNNTEKPLNNTNNSQSDDTKSRIDLEAEQNSGTFVSDILKILNEVNNPLLSIIEDLMDSLEADNPLELYLKFIDKGLSTTSRDFESILNNLNNCPK